MKHQIGQYENPYACFMLTNETYNIQVHYLRILYIKSYLPPDPLKWPTVQPQRPKSKKSNPIIFEDKTVKLCTVIGLVIPFQFLTSILVSAFMLISALEVTKLKLS